MSRPGILLISLVISLAAAASSNAEFPVAAERPIAPLLAFSRGAQIVATDSGFLAFWQTGATAQVARLSRDGQIERRAVVPDPKISWYDAASNGDTVVLTGSCPGAVLCVARFSGDGDFLGVTTLPVGSPIAPVVASNGEDFLITLSTNDTREAVAIRIAADGTAGAPIVLGPWDQNTHWTSPTAIGDDWFVTFGSSDTQRRLVRLSESGIAASVDLAPPLTFWHQMRIEASGDRILVVIPGYQTALFAIYDAALAQTVPWTPLDGGTSTPKLAPTPSGWLVATKRADGSGVTLQPIGRGGERGAVLETAYGELAANGDRVAILAPADNASASAIRATIVDDRGAMVRDVGPVSIGEAAQIEPAGLEGNGVLVAAWTELTPTERFVVKARAFDAASGTPLAPPIAMPASDADQRQPRLAFNGESFFVVWSEGPYYEAKGARVALDGRLLDAEPIPLFGSGPASVAWNGTAWVVVAKNDRNAITAVRVSPGGIILDSTPAQIAPQRFAGQWMNPDHDPHVACSATQCLVAWHTLGTGRLHGSWNIPPAIWAARIGPDLTVLDPVPLELTIPWEEIADPTRTTVAWNEAAGAWLVTWSFTGAQRIARDGRLLDPPPPGYRADDAVVSAIAEREGWRVLWTTRFGDVFHGWSRTGRAADAEVRVALAATGQKESDARLVDAPRLLALLVREDPASPGSPQVIGRFLDESTPPVPTQLSLSATRISAHEVTLAWTSEVEGVTAFGIYRWDGTAWRLWMNAAATERGLTVPLAAGRAARILLRAEAASGFVDSNPVELAGDRQRRVTR